MRGWLSDKINGLWARQAKRGRAYGNGRAWYFPLAVLLAVLILLTAGCGAGAGQGTAGETPAVTVSVIDVGQGDAILIRTPGEVTLIDTGDVPARDKLVAYLRQQGVHTIDQVIITHPHADHLGGMAAVLANFVVKHVYDSGQTTTTGLFQQYLQTVERKHIPFTVVKAGDAIELGGGARLLVLAPSQPFITGTDSDLNNNSVVVKLVYRQFSMLLPGDSEREAEARLLATGADNLRSTVLKVGHHGSSTATSPAFLRAVAPEVAVISLGTGNPYGHPHQSTLKRLAAAKVQVYRTDENGTVTITTDGQHYTVKKER